MNELEQRIYTDAAKVAAEVNAADVPPLRLSRRHGRPVAGRRTGQHLTLWSGGAPGAVSRRILAPLAAAACIAALVVALVVAGNGSSRRTRLPAAPSKHVRIDRLLGTEALDWYFPASGATYTEGLAFAWAQDKFSARDIDPCLAAAGFPQPPFRGSRHFYQLSFPDLSQFPDLAQLAAHPVPSVFTGQYPVVHDPTNARMNAFDRVQARCTARFARSVTRVDRAAAGLQNRWDTITSAIEASRPVSSTQPSFARCLEAHGVPASFATQTSNASNPLFAGYFAWADSTSQAATSNAQQVAEQRHETRVFVACAPTVVRVLERLQLQRRAQFFGQNARQVALIMRLAEEIGDRSARTSAAPEPAAS
jgi:hypothetical protein